MCKIITKIKITQPRLAKAGFFVVKIMEAQKLPQVHHIWQRFYPVSAPRNAVEEVHRRVTQELCPYCPLKDKGCQLMGMVYQRYSNTQRGENAALVVSIDCEKANPSKRLCVPVDGDVQDISA